jgi:hypothetical protein
MRYIRAFGYFWYDFLVGDRPELFVGPIVALAIIWFAVQSGLGAVAGLGLTVLVLAIGGASLVLASRIKG